MTLDFNHFRDLTDTPAHRREMSARTSEFDRARLARAERIAARQSHPSADLHIIGGTDVEGAS